MAQNLELNFEEGGPLSKAKGAEYQGLEVKQSLSELKQSLSELKQSLSELKQIVQSVAAFATAKGGVIRVGYAPDDQRRGVQIGKGSLEGLANDIKMNTEPPQFPSIAVEGEENDAILQIEVSESPLKPVAAYKVHFKRVGRTNQELARDEVHRLMEETTNRTWDAVPFGEFSAARADPETVADYLCIARQRSRIQTGEVVEELGVSRRTVVRMLNAMVEAGVLHRVGIEGKKPTTRPMNPRSSECATNGPINVPECAIHCAKLCHIWPIEADPPLQILSCTTMQFV